jgi:hypothetical protein
MSQELIRVISEFRGNTRWILTADNCLQTFHGMTFHSDAKLGQTTQETRAEGSTITSEKLASDVLGLAAAIEEKLHLTNAQPHVFSAAQLNKEGLAKTPDSFQDFDDGGELTVYLVTEPGRQDEFEVSEHDVLLHFGPREEELIEILGEIVGKDLTSGHGQILTPNEKEKIGLHYPTLFAISNYYEDSYLSPDQAGHLYQECETLANSTSSVKALRGLDKLMRIGRWASEKKYGLLFVAP